MRVLHSNFSANAMARAYLLLRHPSFISGVFTLLNWQKFLLFIILLIDEQLIPVCSAILRGPRCVYGASSCKQISSSINLVFSSVVTGLGRPEPSFLLMMPLSLKHLKVFSRMCKSSFSMNGLSKFYTHTTLFLHNHLNDDFVFFWKHDSDEKILWAKRQFVNNI